MMAQVFAKGYRADILRRVLCFALFWHTLDIIWVAIVHHGLSDGSRGNEPFRLQACIACRRTRSRATSTSTATRPPRASAAICSASASRRCSPPSRSSSRAPPSSGSPSIPVALVVLAIAQMGVHLVFFLHITTGPDNTNNVLALAFGVLIVLLVMVGSLWIMYDLNHNMTLMQMPTG